MKLREKPYQDDTVVAEMPLFDNETVDVSFEGLPFEAPAETTSNEIVNADMGAESLLSQGLAFEERICRQEAIKKEAAPIIQDTVKEAVKLNNERLKLEVNEVLSGEVGYRLDKYEKRRKFRERRDLVVGVLKWGLALLVVAVIFGNVTLRTRCQIVLKDIGDLVSGLIHNEEVTSNQLVEDLFRDLGEDLNRVNTETIEADED